MNEYIPLPSFSIPFPDVVDEMAPDLAAALESFSATHFGPRQFIDQLKEWSDRVYTLSREPRVREDLVAKHQEAVDQSVQPAVAALSLVISQYHFHREMPLEARDWNQRARSHLNGLGARSPFPRAVIDAQQAAIELQADNLPEAVNLSERLVRQDLPSRHKQLIEPLVQAIRMRKVLESGRYDPSAIHDTRAFNKSFQHGRFFLQSARYKDALTSFETALTYLDTSENLADAWRYIVGLHIARSHLGLGRLDEALLEFRQLSSHFEQFALHKAKLSADIYAADVLRHQHALDSSREIVESALKHAKDLGLRKEAFRALVVLGMLGMAEGKFMRSRELLDQAEKYLSVLHVKDKCTLYRSRAQLEIWAGNRARAVSWGKKAQNLLPPEALDEKALLRANIGIFEVWSMIKDGILAEARDLAIECLASIEVVLSGDSPEYSAETYPYLYGGRLWWAVAYCDVRARKPTAALQATTKAQDTLGAIGDRGQRLKGKILFVEALAYAELGDLSTSLERLVQAAALSPNDRPIADYVSDLRRRDNPAIVNQIAFELYCALDRYDRQRFGPLKEDLALAIAPTGQIAFSEEDYEETSPNDWESLADLVRSYRERLRAQTYRERLRARTADESDLSPEESEEFKRVVEEYLGATEEPLNAERLENLFGKSSRGGAQLKRVWRDAREYLASLEPPGKNTTPPSSL